jgi:thiol-disulfide isomerase/thioredoxin
MIRSSRFAVGLVVLAVLASLAAVVCGDSAEPASDQESTDVASARPTLSPPRPTSEPSSETQPSLTDVPSETATPTEVATQSDSAEESQPVADAFPSGRAPEDVLAAELVGLQGWINSEPFTLEEQRGNVVLIDFWTYTCINCIRTFPALRSWHEKYADQGLVILGLHAPEFEFEKIRENVVQAALDNDLGWPIAQDNDHDTWRAFKNKFWPAKYLIDKDGYIRYTHFGEGSYAETEEKIQQLLAEAGASMTSIEVSDEFERDIDQQSRASADPYENQTRELYAGFNRNYNALAVGNTEPYVRHQEYFESPNQEIDYSDPGDHVNHFLYLEGLWVNGFEELIHARKTEDYEDYVGIAFAALEANVVVSVEDGETYEVRVTIDGGPLDPSQAGADIRFDDEGNSYILVDKSDLYHLVQLSEFGSHDLTLSSNSDKFSLFAYTFGSYLEPGDGE